MDSLTYEQLLEKYPACARDIYNAYIASGAKYDNCRFKITIERLATWADWIEWTTNPDYWPEPDDEFEERVEAIVSAIRDGAKPFPVFCNSDNDWVPHGLAEGCHRMVAFHRLGLESVEVVSIDWEATKEAIAMIGVAEPMANDSQPSTSHTHW